MSRLSLSVLVLLAVALGSTMPASVAHAQPSSSGSMNLQGRLTGIPDGTRDLTLFLHDAEIGGNQVASFGPLATSVAGGLFTANFQVPPATFDGRTLWWSVSVDGSLQTSRVLITSVPYAANASRLASAQPGGAVPLDGSLVVSTPADGFVDPVNVFRNGERLFTVLTGGGTELRNLQIYDASTQRYPLVLTNSSGAGGISVSTVPGGSLDPVAVFHAGQRLFTVVQDGRTQVRVLEILGGADLAESFAASPAADGAVKPKPGMILSIDPDHPGALRVATDAYDARVAGVYSGGNGLPTGMIMGKEGCDLTAPGEDKLPLAMTGRVWVYADESSGAITPGDRLTTSGLKPGHAMKVTDAARADGSVIGKAMTGVDAKTGMVLVLVNLQ